MWAAIGIICIKLSDDVFYSNFDLSENYSPKIKKTKINLLINVDDVFSHSLCEGYEKIIEEQDDKQRRIYSADELIDVLEDKIMIFGDAASFGKFTTNSISIVMSLADPKVVEGNYKVIRDLLAKYGWYMSINRDYVKSNGDITGYRQLIFKPIQIPEVTVDVKKDNKVIYHLTKLDNIPFIKKRGLIPSNNNKQVLYTENRIYFLKENITDLSFESTIRTICSQKSIKRDNSEICCLVINVSKIPDDVKFYYDAHFSYGLFATDSIPYSAIEHIYSFDENSDMIDMIDKSLFNKIYKLVKKVFAISK